MCPTKSQFYEYLNVEYVFNKQTITTFQTIAQNAYRSNDPEVYKYVAMINTMFYYDINQGQIPYSTLPSNPAATVDRRRGSQANHLMASLRTLYLMLNALMQLKYFEAECMLDVL